MFRAELMARDLLDALILDGYGSRIDNREEFIERYKLKYQKLLNEASGGTQPNPIGVSSQTRTKHWWGFKFGLEKEKRRLLRQRCASKAPWGKD